MLRKKSKSNELSGKDEGRNKSNKTDHVVARRQLKIACLLLKDDTKKGKKSK